MYFPDIADMAFGGEGGVVPLFQIARSDADLEPEFVHGPVEHHVVIGHVEVAVIIDPARLDLHDRGFEHSRAAQAFVDLGHSHPISTSRLLTAYTSFATVAP